MKQSRAGWAIWLGSVFALATLNCGGGLDEVGDSGAADGSSPTPTASASTGGPPDIVRKPGPDNTPDPAETVAGQFLARVNVTATHSVEFWELQPGNVMVVQALNTAAGEHRLELEDLLQASGGLYSGLYRTLLHDDKAPVPQGLVAADEHRHQLPIRDARLPLPVVPTAPDVSLRLGALVANSAAPVAAQPGALQTLGLHHTGGGVYGIFDQEPGFCSWVKADSWCPPGAYYGFANGNIQETIFFDALGHNPQTSGGAAASDTMVVNQIVYGSGLGVWATVFTYGLWPGHTVEAYAGANPTIYQGQITGSIVSYGERWRLSFPQLSESGRHPDDGDTQAFMNGLNGITHTSNSWIMSRTQGPNIAGWNRQGCLAQFGFGTDIQNYDGGGRCPHYVPQIQNSGSLFYDHFGDLVYDPVYPPGYTPGGKIQQGTGLLFISSNETGSKNGGVVAVDPSAWNYYGYTILNYLDQVAWVAVDPRTRAFYTSSSNGLSIHQHQFTLSGSWLNSPWPYSNLTSRLQGACINSSTTYYPSCSSDDIPLTNSPGTLNIQGGKVSSHGKLWVWTNDRKTLYGIDPYTGIVQASFPWDTGYDEAEGLDITEGIASPVSTNVGGQIHLQNLTDGTFQATWQLVNINVSDLGRL